MSTPAAAVMVEELAKHSDFLSVGTNDLTQYTLAVDRGNASLADRFTPFHPAVVRTLRRLVQAGNGTQRPVSVCGEMASEPKAALLLLVVLSLSLGRTQTLILIFRDFFSITRHRKAPGRIGERPTMHAVEEADAPISKLKLFEF